MHFLRDWHKTIRLSVLLHFLPPSSPYWLSHRYIVFQSRKVQRYEGTFISLISSSSTVFCFCYPYPSFYETDVRSATLSLSISLSDQLSTRIYVSTTALQCSEAPLSDTLFFPRYFEFLFDIERYFRPQKWPFYRDVLLDNLLGGFFDALFRDPFWRIVPKKGGGLGFPYNT